MSTKIHKSDQLEQQILKKIKPFLSKQILEEVEELLDEMNSEAFDEGFKTANSKEVKIS